MTVVQSRLTREDRIRFCCGGTKIVVGHWVLGRSVSKLMGSGGTLFSDFLRYAEVNEVRLASGERLEL